MPFWTVDWIDPFMNVQRPLNCFLAIFLADLIVRTAYMAGKSPVLPVFAAQLGASEVILGAIVSISTLTGLVWKPVFGFLSDRNGRWIWLLIGTALFCITPLLYLRVDTTSQLIQIRLIHGIATAIYGPVTLAYIADLKQHPKAEWFGWFSLSRTGGYVLGPLIGGALLGYLSPAQVLASTSLIALLAFFPVMFIRSSKPVNVGAGSNAIGVMDALRIAMGDALSNRPLKVFALVEMTSQIGLYAVKVFLPLIILARGGTAFEAGVFLSIQEGTAAILRPIAGKMSDLTGQPKKIVACGLVCMAFALALIPAAIGAEWLTSVAILMGAGSGIYAPAALSLIASASRSSTKGTAFGFVGALRNAGKLVGPIIAGGLLYVMPMEQAFILLAALPLFAVALLLTPYPMLSKLEGSSVKQK